MMQDRYLPDKRETGNLIMEQNERSNKHQRGSSPQSEAEQIYHNWLKRVRPATNAEEKTEIKGQEELLPKAGPQVESHEI